MPTANPVTTTSSQSLQNVGNPSKHKAITLGSDVDVTALLGGAACGLYVGGAGNVTLTDAYGNSATYVGVPAGSYLSLVFVTIVNATTTAGSLIAVGL